jgi:hypothetical protein
MLPALAWRHFPWAALVFFSLGAAAADSLSEAEQKFHALTNAVQSGVNFDLLSTKGLTQAEKERREKKAAELFKPACVKPYTETLQASVSAATERAKEKASLDPLKPLPDQARFLDTAFNTCMARYGVSGFNFVRLQDGRDLRLPAYLEETISALHGWGTARSKEGKGNADAALALLAAILRSGRYPNPGATCFESSIQKPSPFLGNYGDIFELTDGSLWEVEDGYEYLYEYYPQVVMCPGTGKLVIKGKRISVQQMR